MKVLITGNLGYVGPAVVGWLRERHPGWTIDGCDAGYFAHCLTGVRRLPEALLDRQVFADVRDVGRELLEGYDGIVQLAAISNDPMGSAFSRVTQEINCDAAAAIARAAAAAGVRSMVYASSCSVYGVADGPRSESDQAAPLTAYARSKVQAELELHRCSGPMVTTCLRFATACGMSDRLRLDLVVNDFAASAVATNAIEILSDGSPWRPLIDVRDMARAIEWALLRPADNGGLNLTLNAGCERANYRVIDIAEAVAAVKAGTQVKVNSSAAVDSRSYRVDFGLFERLAPEHQPAVTLQESIEGLVEGLGRMGFQDENFRHSSLMRLQVLNEHIAAGRLGRNLRWASRSS